MAFKDQLITDMDGFFNADEFADIADFYNGTATVSVPVIIDHDVLVQADGYDVGVSTMGTTISAQVADVGTPSRGNTFLVDGTTYTVQRIEENDNVVVKMVVK